MAAPYPSTRRPRNALALGCWLSAFSYQLSAFSFQLSAFGCRLSACRPSTHSRRADTDSQSPTAVGVRHIGGEQSSSPRADARRYAEVAKTVATAVRQA